jgi:hypothetical protein
MTDGAVCSGLLIRLAQATKTCSGLRSHELCVRLVTAQPLKDIPDHYLLNCLSIKRMLGYTLLRNHRLVISYLSAVSVIAATSSFL